jgi:CRP/FNR family transcriptional regulator, polysaccharide utilization system transcription regulator
MKKVLLIEDNDEVRENTAEILELANYNVVTAKNGKIGVELATDNHPDLIICDIMMPVLDGYGVLHLLSKNTETASIPFIFLTAKTERSDIRKGMEMGADDYVTKPFDDIELLNAVESRLKKVEALKNQYQKGEEGLNNLAADVKGIKELDNFALNKKIINVKKKQLVYNEGTNPHGLYLIKKGKVKTYKSNEMGKELIISLFREGDYFGYPDLLDDTMHRESAAALEDCEILMIPKSDFNSLVYKNAYVASKFIKMLANDVAEKESQLIKIAYNSVRKRVAEALVNLFDRYTDNKMGNFQMAISRDDVANLSGTSTETAIRTLSDFKEEKIIEIKGSMITILQVEKLRTMKN